MKKNHNITYDDYLKIKEKYERKPYALRFRKTRFWLMVFSFFGNFASIFLAYFFFSKLIGFATVQTSIITSIVIVLFLALFEFIKRYIFDQFCHEFVLLKYNAFKKQMLSFAVGTLMIISLSFFFSLHGAKDFMNKENIIVSKTEVNITAYQDSINNYYFKQYIKQLQDENSKNIGIRDNLSSQQSTLINKGWSTKQVDKQYLDINNQIEKNKDLIVKYETERDKKITEFKETQLNKLSESKSENTSNIYLFLLISTFIESIIMIGIYFNRIYERNVTDEYERTVSSLPNFKKWLKYNQLLELVYQHGILKTGDVIPATSSVVELVKINGIDATETDVQNFFKIISYLNIYIKEGNRRILSMDKEKAFPILKEHFKIK
jgi:hypothetical protein